jgi:long-chain fatty acid transport protein
MSRTTLRRSIIVALAAGITVPVSALATNGYFAHGWGTKSKAMAGVATALPQDTLVTATNPAGEAFIGDSLDVGVAFFHPAPRGYDANADFSTSPYPGGPSNFPSGPFVAPGTVESSSDWFAIPSFGYNRQLDSHQTIGIALYGNGGMNTHYNAAVWSNFAVAPNQAVAILPTGQQFPLYAFPNQRPMPITVDQAPATIQVPLNPLNPSVTVPVVNGNPGGTLTAYAPTGVNLEQLFIEIPYTYKFGNGSQSVGIAPVIAIQDFEARGLQPFQAASVDPAHVTNNGKDWSYGAGLHFGWYGQLTDQLAAGISYRTKVWMTKFNDYSGLFADGGNFDIPAMFNLGLAYKVQPNVTVAFDYQHIFYDEINAISNSNDIDLTPCFGAGIKPSYCLGAKSGLGFGWKSMDVFKLGVRWEPNAKWKLFGGVSYNTELLKTNQQALFNVLTPATIRWHLTLGGTYVLSPKDEFNLSFAYMPKETVNGTSPSITQAQTGSLFMEQEDIEISWSHHF